jgi:hypothetical protein
MSLRYHRNSGLWIPPAIPTEDMLRDSPLVAAAIGRHACFYITTIFKIAPAYTLALWSPLACWSHRILWVWVGTWVGGMTALGCFGQVGFQTRFILPALPALSALAAGAVTR